MKKIFLLLFTFFSVYVNAQDTGSIAGKLTDKEFDNEPLPFANILIKGTSKGTTTDDAGLYMLDNLKPGDYVIE